MILVWNSSSNVVHIELVNDEGVQMARDWEAGRSLARDMLAYLRDMVADCEQTFDDITGIASYRGPGSYTGLRIGLTVLNTLASTESIPIVGATGDDWRSDCLRRLAAGEDDKVVLPEYGGEATVTQQKK